MEEAPPLSHPPSEAVAMVMAASMLEEGAFTIPELPSSRT